MTNKIIRIGTRDSQLAVWQATLVQNLLKENGIAAELVYIKSEGDIDLVTPLYEIGVQGVFTKTLDAALLANHIDIAVHSMKDVPTQLAKGIVQAAVLKRASYKDILVLHPHLEQRETRYTKEHITIISTAGRKDKKISWSLPLDEDPDRPGHPGNIIIATSSVRRIAQWLHEHPNTTIENLRGNVNTRLRKLEESNWHGAIFAAAGLERIGLRPAHSIELDWMLPAPAQGAIMVVCREGDDTCLEALQPMNDAPTALCTKIERDFLRALMGGCSTPISALAEVTGGSVYFRGNMVSTDGKNKAVFEDLVPVSEAATFGAIAAEKILQNGGQAIIDEIRKTGKSL